MATALGKRPTRQVPSYTRRLGRSYRKLKSKGVAMENWEKSVADEKTLNNQLLQGSTRKLYQVPGIVRYSCGVTGEVAVCGRWTLDSVATCDQSGKSRDYQDAEKLGK
ncbi:hypothetical protein RUM44_004606 [Polyplax serrata]|uniref:Uncharacterized protein n=1 Tax=Polyplax serrata TaxID=468196 RepID=A0ABR1B3B2_POLSC